MTVGEVVRDAWRQHKWLWEREDKSEVPAFRVQDVLTDLGIWDAEVLEGKVHHGFDTDCAGFYPSDGTDSRDLAGLIDPSYGGRVVRFIVLPKGEK